MLIDTHCHLYLPQFDEDLDRVEERFLQIGVEHVLLPNIDIDSVERLELLVKRNPTIYKPMMGLHPCSVKEDAHEQWGKMKEMFAANKHYVAVGEIGLDLFWDKSFEKLQVELFLEQMKFANEQGLPVSIHCRDAFSLMLEVMPEHLKACPESKIPFRGVFHCFSGVKSEAEQMIEWGFALGIGGVYTYKKANLAEELKGIDPKYLVFETDAPYLAPVPNRSKRNEPAFLLDVLYPMATALGMEPSKLGEITSSTAKQIFSLN